MNKKLEEIKIKKIKNKVFLIKIYNDNTYEKIEIKGKYYEYLINMLVCIELDLL